ncbi:hypothetical protein GGF42_000422 [Coemansia sp. RSA 2424]|nr:hypothetical protein GGF42_000422 [Coemansia sp. RSA 2424]
MPHPPYQPARSRVLSARAHSYSHGDFASLHAEPARPTDASPLSSIAASARSASQRLAQASPVRQHLLHTPSSPLVRPLDSENEVAQTILMLGTPPAARAPSLPISPSQQPTRIGRPAVRTGRRLSFPRCQTERPRKRPRHGDAAEEAPLALAAQMHTQPPSRFLTPNLSDVAALSQRTLAHSRPERHAPSAATKRVLAPPK